MAKVQALVPKVKSNRAVRRATGILGMPDSIELWCDIIDKEKIPDSAFFKGMRILNICAGTGTEAEVLRERLFSLGWTSEEINSAVCLIDLSLSAVQELLAIGFRNVIHGDVLDWEFVDNKGHLMKFDLILGNPPYQDSTAKAKNNKLWHKISERAIDFLAPNGTIAFITPSSVFVEHGAGGKINKRITTDLTLTHSAILSKNVFVGVAVEIGYWIVVNRRPNDVVTGSPRIMTDELALSNSILEKMLDEKRGRLPLLAHMQPVTRNDLGGTKNKILFSGPKIEYTDKDLIEDAKLKLVFPFSVSYYSQFVTELPLGMLNMFMEVTSEDEARRIMSFTLTKAYRFFAATYKRTSGFTPAVKNSMLPALDFSRTWDDDAVYREFGLTDKEILFLAEVPTKTSKVFRV